MTARTRCHPVRQGFYFDVRVTWRTRQCHALHDGQVRPVISHRGGLCPVQLQSLQNLLCRRRFVFGAVAHVLNSQSL